MRVYVITGYTHRESVNPHHKKIRDDTPRFETVRLDPGTCGTLRTEEVERRLAVRSPLPDKISMTLVTDHPDKHHPNDRSASYTGTGVTLIEYVATVLNHVADGDETIPAKRSSIEPHLNVLPSTALDIHDHRNTTDNTSLVRKKETT